MTDPTMRPLSSSNTQPTGHESRRRGQSGLSSKRLRRSAAGRLSSKNVDSRRWICGKSARRASRSRGGDDEAAEGVAVRRSPLTGP